MPNPPVQTHPSTVARFPRDLDPVAQQIDETAAGALELFRGADSFSKELKLAQAMMKLRAMLTPDVMAPIMELMNTELGFRTDRDPKRCKPGERVEPYPLETVRDCFIESKLRGFRTVGNEWNIIAGNFYAAREGFRRKLTDGLSFPKLANLKYNFDVPKLSGDKGAIVKCRAEWDNEGTHDGIEAEFAVRVNMGMGADGIIGKAERKLLRRVHDRLQGVHTPEGDVAEGPTIDVAPAPPRKPAFADTPKGPAPGPQAPQTAPEAPGPVFTPGPAARALGDFLAREGIAFSDLQALVLRERFDESVAWDAIASVDEVPEASAARLVRSQAGLLRFLKPQPTAPVTAPA